MRRMLIIADDLSGAADCAIACVSSGLSAVVAFGDGHRDLTGEVLSIDCDTRHLNSAAAAHRVAEVFRGYMPDPDLLVFKKLDSTLRGNVGAELFAILEERRRSGSADRRIVALMAPAFPAGGRTTVDAQQLVHGIPLHESEIWRYQGSLGSTHIPSVLAMAGLRSAPLGLELVRSGNASLRQGMKALATSADVLVCDVETDEDLRAIADSSVVLGRETVWAGSAGLAYHLPLASGLFGRSSAVEVPALASGPTLIVIGSMSSVSREQVALLEDASHISTVHLSPRVLLAGPQSSQWTEHERKISMALQSGRDTLVVLKAGELLDFSESRVLSSALGTIMKPVAGVVGALVASGGETARAILDAWGIKSLRMIREVEPGLPFAVAEGWDRSLPVLTKAGAFGSLRTLLHCSEFLHTLERGTKSAYTAQKGS
jgi:uncharacterized protein YgbK (DUF1537 family)